MDSLSSVAKKLEALNHVPIFVMRSNKLTADQKSFAVLQNLLVSTYYMITANFKRILEPLAVSKIRIELISQFLFTNGKLLHKHCVLLVDELLCATS